MKKIALRFVSLMLCVVVCAGLVGCGGSTKSTDGKIDLTVMISGEDVAEGALMQKWKAAYEAENPAVNINITNFTGNYSQAMMTNVQSVDLMPDIMWTTGEQHVAWSDAGVFIDLKSKIAADSSIDLNDFYPEVVNITHKNSKDNGIYFMPRDYNKCVLYINKYMFRAAGFSDQEIADLKNGWNYEKFLSVCEKLRSAMDKDLNPAAGIRERSVPVDANMAFNASYMSFFEHFGGNLVENGKIKFDSEKNMNAYGQMFGLISKGYFAELSKAAACSFTNLSAAMLIGVRPKLPTLPTTEKYDIDFLPLPTNAVGIGCSGYAITSVAAERVSPSNKNEGGKTNADYAFDFLRFIVSEQGQKIGCETGSIVPALKSLANDDSWRACGRFGRVFRRLHFRTGKRFFTVGFQRFQC
ncbi:MAG: extracellular solute-binding protein [Clostridia bacterium]|nr:extracellular solute-binding protein [Clostridia bacterium]